MLHALVSTASRMLNDLNRTLFPGRIPGREVAVPPPLPRVFRRLQRLVLTDEVGRTLFQAFAEHCRSSRGEEETGWMLLGVREPAQTLVLATLPAGAERSAGVAHVRFNAGAQALASRIVRQWDRRLSIVGVVHTHPGSLRHPSDGDFRGDSLWVGRLRGREGIFGIGTADAESPGPGVPLVAHQPRLHVQCLGDLCLSWYALGEGERRYRPLPVHLTLGPDLARPLHPIWETIETFADPLDRLCQQQAQVTFEVSDKTESPGLAVNLKLAGAGSKLRLVLEKKKVRYFLHRDDDIIEVDPKVDQLERGVYLILAELAGQS